MSTIHPVVVRVLKFKLGEKLSKEEQHLLALEYVSFVTGKTPLEIAGEVWNKYLQRPNPVGRPPQRIVHNVPLVTVAPKMRYSDVTARTAKQSPSKSVSSRERRRGTDKIAQPKLLIDAVMLLMKDLDRVHPNHIHQRFQHRGWKGSQISIRKVMAKYRGVLLKRVGSPLSGLYAAI